MIFLLLSIFGGAALQPRPADGRKGENWFDIWSLLHIASGAVLAACGLSWKWAVLILVAFEIWEMGMRKGGNGEGLFEYESYPNIVADVLFGLLGFFLLKNH